MAGPALESERVGKRILSFIPHSLTHTCGLLPVEVMGVGSELWVLKCIVMLSPNILTPGYHRAEDFFRNQQPVGNGTYFTTEKLCDRSKLKKWTKLNTVLSYSAASKYWLYLQVLYIVINVLVMDFQLCIKPYLSQINTTLLLSQIF